MIVFMIMNKFDGEQVQNDVHALVPLCFASWNTSVCGLCEGHFHIFQSGGILSDVKGDEWQRAIMLIPILRVFTVVDSTRFIISTFVSVVPIFMQVALILFFSLVPLELSSSR